MDNHTNSSNGVENLIKVSDGDVCLTMSPLTITVEQLGEMLGIGRVSAYNLVHQKGFPSKKIGRRIIIPYQAFLEWLNK